MFQRTNKAGVTFFIAFLKPSTEAIEVLYAFRILGFQIE